VTHAVAGQAFCGAFTFCGSAMYEACDLYLSDNTDFNEGIYLIKPKCKFLKNNDYFIFQFKI